jgi:queuosine precursor transporter
LSPGALTLPLLYSPRMNEVLFLLHVAFVLGFGCVALRMGRPGLTAWVALQAVMANLFVIKQIGFLGFHITCSDVFAIGSLFGLHLLREYFGEDAAKKALRSCFLCMLFFAAMAQIHLLYMPSPYDTTQGAFETLLSPSPRLLFASLAAFFIVQHIDLRFFGRLKKKFPQLPLTLRNAVCVSATQLLDTLLFSLLGLWGQVGSLGDIILVSFLIKLVLIALMSPLIHVSRRLVRPHAQM